jgi:hypothetical protein
MSTMWAEVSKLNLQELVPALKTPVVELSLPLRAIRGLEF